MMDNIMISACIHSSLFSYSTLFHFAFELQESTFSEKRSLSKIYAKWLHRFKDFQNAPVETLSAHLARMLEAKSLTVCTFKNISYEIFNYV